MSPRRVEDHGWINVKVRFKDRLDFVFLSDHGRTSRQKIRAVTFPDVASARAAAEHLVEANENVAAARVVSQFGRYYHVGEPTPPKPKYGPAGGYTYLTRVEKGRGYFEVRDEAGRWGTATRDVWEAIFAEKQRAGLTNRITVTAAITHMIGMNDVHFVQALNRAEAS